MRKRKIKFWIILLLLTLVFLLSLSSCSKKGRDPAIGDDPNPKTNSENQERENQIHWSKDDLAGIGFLGYNPTGNLDIFRESREFKDFIDDYLPLFDSLAQIYTGQAYGDEVYFILPRYDNSKILISDAEDESIVYYDGDGKSAILLLTNLGDLRPESKITIIHEGKKVAMSPMLSGMDGALIFDQKGFRDLSPANNGPGNQIDSKDISLLEGNWLCEYENIQGQDAELTLIFSNYQDVNDIKFYDLVLINPTTETEMDGWCYFRSPVDFEDPGDHQRDLLYFDLTGPSKDGRFQMFGKFDWELLGPDLLQIMHYSWDPLMGQEYDYLYYFKRRLD